MTEKLELLAIQLPTAEELLVRAGCAQAWHPWVVTKGAHSATFIDFEALEQCAHTLDPSEEGIARIALSLATGRRVNLHTAFGFLTRDHAELVMTAVAYAGGHDQAGSRIILHESRRQVRDSAPLAAWDRAQASDAAH